MVKIYTVISFLFFSSLAYGQIYVNASATGANNGTSWANAFTTVESALAATGTNIWIARGTYKPAGAANDTTVSFKMTTPKNIYGGFAGTEITIAARNLAANITILNGDMLGNDNVDSLYVNKSDNRRHVLLIDSLVRGTIILDGLTVSGGATKNVTSGTNRKETSGGGILSYTSLTIRNCRFLNNYGLTGGGVCVLGDSLYTSDVLVENTTFEKNLGMATGHNGAGIYTTLIDSVVFNNVTAIGNKAVQGAIGVWNGNYIGMNNCTITENVNNYAGVCAGMIIIGVRHQNIQNTTITKNTSNIGANGTGIYISNAAFITDPNNSTTFNKCIFRDNLCQTSIGAALRIEQGNKISLIDCEIASNTSTYGMVFITSATSIFGKADNLLIRNCKFFNNTSIATTTNRGGALVLNSNTGLIKDCSFENNVGVRGAHIAFEGTARPNEFTGPNKITVEDCSFIGGSSPQFGGAVYCAMGNGTTIFKNSTFTGNKSAGQGGVLFVGFKSKVEIDNCDILLNEANTGGVFWVQNDSTVVTSRNSRYNTNMAISGTGGISSSTGSSSCGYIYINNEFVGNSASGTGGAFNISSSVDREFPSGTILFDRNIFEENLCGGQAGAINVSGTGGLIQNNIFLRNEAPNDGVGGAISYNHSDTLLRRELKVINNSFIGNKGDLISGISAWQSKAANKQGRGLVTIQNNIFMETVGVANEPNDTTVNAEIKSLGGNIYTNTASMAFMSASLDQVSASFTLDDEFAPKAGSPAINYGTVLGAPLYDYNNLLRVGRPDAGAIEFGATVSGVKASDIKSLTIYPNPSADYIKVDELAVSNARYLIFSLDGKLVDRGSIPSNGQIDIKKLTVGNYYLQVNDGKLSIGSFVKQ